MELNYDQLKAKRSSIKGKITRIKNWVSANAQTEVNLKHFKLNHDNLLNALDKYDEVQDSIELIPIDQTNDTEDRSETELSVNTLIVTLQECMEKLSPPLSSTASDTPQSINRQSVNTPMVKLPEVKIKPFSGELSEWATFIQLFDALITENPALTNIQRFIYLKSFLRDEPLKIIESLSATNSNFSVAIDLLKKRYENKLSVVNAHFIALLEINSVVKCNAPNLRDFTTSLRRSLDQIKKLNYTDSELWELLLVYLFQKKLDFGTRKAFETERDISVLPNLNQFLEFLEKKSTILENLSSVDSSSDKHKTPRNVNLHVQNDRHAPNPKGQNRSTINCIFCSQSSHKIYKCDRFKKLAHNDRLNFVTSKRLCFNCLGTGHSKNDCTSNNCFLCSRNHHTLLHNPQVPAAPDPHHKQSRHFQAHYSQPVTDQRFQNGQNPMSRNTFVNFNAQCGTSLSHKQPINPQNSQNHDFSIPPPHVESQSLHSNSLNLSSISSRNGHVLLATACVTLYRDNGRPIQAKALLDCASQNSFITTNFVNELNYIPYTRHLNISGISQESLMSNKMVDLIIHSNVYNKQFQLSCAILPNITCKLPQIPLDKSRLNIPMHCKLSDPFFSSPSDIDMLIGADLYYDLLLDETYRLGRNLPVLQNTHLGWVIAGNFPITTPPRNRNSSQLNVNSSFLQPRNAPDTVSMLVHSSEDSSLDKLLPRFWNIEEISEKSVLPIEDELAESIFSSTTKILANNSFQVDLPLKSPTEYDKLGDSFFIAKKRFLNLEKKFQRNPSYFREYKKFIDEYIELNHGRFVPLELTNENSCNKYFFPHHAVIREQSTTTKLRVVFDGSCKTSSHLSLNDIMLKGYQVQPDLFDILCRFRSYKYVLTADIEKMYRQILINPSQTFLLNILWRDNPKVPLNCIELRTVTYGTNCAPFLATRVLNEIAIKNQANYPLASQTLLQQCYVDDLLTGVDNLTQLNDLYTQLNSLLGLHRFHLHKWCSNSKEFLEHISLENSVEINLDFDDHPNKVLGVKWVPFDDTLSISVPFIAVKPQVTKREILSTIAQCYDPLGLLQPVIVLGKIIMQRLWILKLNWDTPITDQSIIKDWHDFSKNLNCLTSLRIPRYLFSNSQLETIEFHGFADSSMKAYAACIYVRTVYQNGNVSSHLLTSKSRVAPIKVVSLPRLELCAMLLLSRLIQKATEIFENRLALQSVHLWTDSKIALCWINSHASRWSTFVANRVSMIQEITSKFQWHHIKSELNPADIPSRGMSPQQIPHCDLWWHGPNFLLSPSIDFSQVEQDFSLKTNEEERKVVLVNLDQVEKSEFWNDLFSRVSKFRSLQRIVAYVLRFIYNSSHPENTKLGTLSVNELQNSLNLIIKVVQEKHFSKEKAALLNEHPVSNRTLLSLNLFLDENKIIRVGGRLTNADIAFDQKHPILLPSHNAVVTLMLIQEHQRLGHAGAQTVLSNVRLKFWPLNGLREIKHIIRKCLTCFRLSAQPSQQIMADLPECRVTASRPFVNVGVDYGGPFVIKSSKLRKAPLIKVYMAIFVCMSTKAVHIELVTDLSTEGFIATFKRFTSRRGNPSQIFSDNATNFLGACNNLKELYAFFKNKNHCDAIHNYLGKSETQFKFIPPRSPHWGGLWESAIKSAKYHIKRLIGNAHLTFENFYTVLTQIEAILNSRPLCALSNDPNDLHSLTPGHFLIGTSLTAFPEKDLTNVAENRLSCWQRCTQIQQNFWKRWSVDYLNRLQHRPKWMKKCLNLKVNDLVLIKEDASIPLNWPLGRVIETFPGRDNHVRAVKLKTQNGIYTRPITKVCLLPENSNNM